MLKTFTNIEYPLHLIHTLRKLIITHSKAKEIFPIGRLFIFNGEELNKEFYEFDFNNETLISKMDTLISKRYMGICECEQCIIILEDGKKIL